VSNIIWIIMIGFIAGIIARVVSPGPNELGGSKWRTYRTHCFQFLLLECAGVRRWSRLRQRCDQTSRAMASGEMTESSPIS
jgi:hypothetical protein